MTEERFRELALDLPEAEESAHMGHPDFRVGGRIFATLGPRGEEGARAEWGMVKLTPEQQARLLRSEPGVFAPASGAWGRGGATIVRLKSAKVASVRKALVAAWRNTAPKRLVERYEGK